MNNRKKEQYNISKLINRISFDGDKRTEIFLSLPYNIRAEILLRLTKHILFILLSSLPDDEIINTLENLDPDEITDIVQNLPAKRRNRIINLLSSDLKNGVEILSQFDPETAAGLMNLDYVQVEDTDTIAYVAKRFKSHEKRTGRLPAIIAMHDGRLLGYVPGHELGFAKPSEQIKKYIRKISVIKHNATHDDVVKVFKDNPHNKIAVVGDSGNVIGIIYSDDILRILEEQKASSLYDFAGVHDEESVTDDAMTKVRFRYKWLIINLGTAFLASFVVSLFDKTISKYVLLAVYMPIVAGMGGNAATQTLAVLVRGITLRQIKLKTAWKTLIREIKAGFINGCVNALIVFSIVIIFNNNIKIAFVLGMAMIINLVIASIFGTIVPLIMKHLGKDPASSATIFITTATDVMGFLSFLGLATLILK